jgi:hypothetical protein
MINWNGIVHVYQLVQANRISEGRDKWTTLSASKCISLLLALALFNNASRLKLTVFCCLIGTARNILPRLNHTESRKRKDPKKTIPKFVVSASSRART